MLPSKSLKPLPPHVLSTCGCGGTCDTNKCKCYANGVKCEMFLPAKAREYFLPALVCVSVSLCVCLSMTTITKKIVDGCVPNFTGRFLGEREDQVRVSLRLVEGCGSNGQKTP